MAGRGPLGHPRAHLLQGSLFLHIELLLFRLPCVLGSEEVGQVGKGLAGRGPGVLLTLSHDLDTHTRFLTRPWPPCGLVQHIILPSLSTHAPTLPVNSLACLCTSRNKSVVFAEHVFPFHAGPFTSVVSLIFTTAQFSRCFYLHFADEKAEAQRGLETGIQSHNY